MEKQKFWKQIQKGDASAFKKLYQEHADILFNYGLKITPNEDLVGETIQDLFVYIYEKRANLTEPISIKAYLLASFRRLLIQEASKLRNTPNISIEDSLFDLQAFDFDVETALIIQEETKQQDKLLFDAIEKLAPRQKEIIYLKYFKGLNNLEISDILGISYQIIRNTSSIAVKHLRLSLSSKKNIT